MTPLKTVAKLSASAIVGTLAFAIPAGQAQAATDCHRVASPSGSDGAAGTLQAPVRSAQRLVDLLGPGEVGCLRAGTYDTDDEIQIDTPRVTLTNYATESPLVVGRLWVSANGNGARVSGLRLNGISPGNLPSPTITADDVVFSGNDVTTSHTAICFIVGEPTYGHAARTVIEDNRIHNCGVMPANNHDHGIYVEEATDTVIRGNWIYDNADRGIQLYPNADRTTIVGNIIDGNGQGIIFGGNSGNTADNNVVERNVISNSNIRHNVESHYDPGDPIGSGNRVRQNCVFGAPGWYGKQGGVQSPQKGFAAGDNLAEAPKFVNAAANDLTLVPGSKCARLLAGSLTVGVTITVNRRNVRANQALAVLGKTSGAEKGDSVTLSVKGARGWVTVGRSRVRADGSFARKVRVRVPRSTKVARVRATVAGLGDSSPVKLKVRPKG